MSRTSVIVPARDPGPFLVETLASVAAQTSPPVAVIVVDDGSADDVVADAVEHFPGMTLIRQGPLGTGAARNAGIAATGTEFVLFLDADDLLRPGALEALAAVLEADPTAQMVSGRVSEFVDEVYPPQPGTRHANSEAVGPLPGATLIRRSAWDRVGSFNQDLQRGEWIEWMGRAAAHNLASSAIAEVVLERRLHAFNKSAPAAGDRSYLLDAVHSAIVEKRRLAREQG